MTKYKVTLRRFVPITNYIFSMWRVWCQVGHEQKVSVNGNDGLLATESRSVITSAMPCPTLWLLRWNTVDLEHIDDASSTSVAFDSITTDPRPPRAHQDRDGTMHAGCCKLASVFVHDLPTISHHNEQKQDVISEGDIMLSY